MFHRLRCIQVPQRPPFGDRRFLIDRSSSLDHCIRMKPTVVIGFLGSTLDASKFGPSRWNKWRPTVGLCMHEDLRVDRLVLLYGKLHGRLTEYVIEDIASVSPETTVEKVRIDLDDPWDFEEVY